MFTSALAIPNRARFIALAVATSLVALPASAQAQRGRGGTPGPMRDAAQLDVDGKTAQARAIYQSVLDTTTDPAAKADVQRAMAMSYAFDGDCANTLKYEQMVIDYWVTREQAEPQNAFYQEGEMADEGARVCIDAGDLDAAEQWYRKGYELGTKEPAPQTHSKSLWDYRLAHALGRIAARRGDEAEAERQIAAARKALDGDSAMAAQQERFFPYLVGYVALYTGNLKTAESRVLEDARHARQPERSVHELPAGHDVREDGRAGEGRCVVPEGLRDGQGAQPAGGVRAAVRAEEAEPRRLTPTSGGHLGTGAISHATGDFDALGGDHDGASRSDDRPGTGAVGNAGAGHRAILRGGS